jgi:hypothetical protein
MGNGIFTAKRSRIAFSVAVLSILIGSSSLAFAKEGPFLEALHLIDVWHKVAVSADKVCHSWFGENLVSEPNKSRIQTGCSVVQNPKSWFREYEPGWLKRMELLLRPAP